MYKIKSKMVNGILKYGLIDENLNEVAEFKYKEITPIEGMKDAFYLKNEDNTLSVFMYGLTIKTKYRELTFVPSEICGYCNRFIARTSRKAELISINEDYNEKKLKINVITPKYMFDDKFDTKIDDIRLESEGITLYTKTEEGMLKGYYGHKILGNLRPEYVDVKSYSYVSSKPYIPKFNKDECYTTQFEKDWESRYAIVTKRVRGKLKKGIIIRKKTEHGDKWVELIPPKYDDIIPQENGDFITINYKNGKPKKGLIHMTTYFDMYSKGACIYGCASLQKEFEIENDFDEVYRLTEIPAEYKNENDYIYYIVSKKGKLGLYKGRTMEARGNYDYCDNEHPDHPLLEKMLDCEYDSIESMIEKLNLKNYQRKYYIETFKATKGDVSSLVFDKKSENDEFVKTDCEFKKIHIGCDHHDHAYYI